MNRTLNYTLELSLNTGLLTLGPFKINYQFKVCMLIDSASQYELQVLIKKRNTFYSLLSVIAYSGAANRNNSHATLRNLLITLKTSKCRNRALEFNENCEIIHPCSEQLRLHVIFESISSFRQCSTHF